MSRLSRVGGALVLTAAATTLTLPTPAHAASEPPRSAVVTCTGEIFETFSPGLTMHSRPVEVTAHSELSCTGGKVKSVTMSSKYTLEAGCLANQLISVGSPELDWDNGENSTATLTYAVGRPAGQTVSVGVGSVLKGQFRDYAMTRSLGSFTPDAHKCFGDGVTSSRGFDHITLSPQA
ncbi:hypothetical protein [Streptomyces longisporoflavus]|uniref:Secreted protein n=1 Tax=Streptomyces longisporoflavus TaxID=28044 RepID=A0ABW7R2U2_9ACTN